MRRAAGVIALFLFTAAAFVGVDAQTRKPRPKPRPLATPVQTLTGAEIISQASESTIDPATQVQPQPSETPRRSATSERLNTIDARLKRLESPAASDPDAKQKRLETNLRILQIAEQRADNLRKQVFDLIEKQNSVQKRLDEIEYEIQPEVIERQLQLAGSLRPEEVRENRRKQLAAEQTNLQTLLTQVQGTRASLEAQLAKADDLVAKLRDRIDKEIDDSLLKDDSPVDQPDQP
jgi:peptidoglycan hydrolase CwlO-like protein